MIFKTFEDTTYGASFVPAGLKEIRLAISKCFIECGLQYSNLSVKPSGHVKPVFVTGSDPSEQNIPMVTHPITVIFNDVTYIVADLRLFLRKAEDGLAFEDRIRNRIEYNFVRSRTILNMLWLDGMYSHLRNTFQFAHAVYVEWLSKVIEQAFALDFVTGKEVAVILSVFYQSLFEEQTKFDEDSIQRMATHVIKVTQMPGDRVFDIMDKIAKLPHGMNNVNDLCEAIRVVTGNVRLDKFSFGVLLSKIANSWWGTNHKEVLAVSLEHPPTFIALVFNVLNEKSYKNSTIFKIADKIGKRGVADLFFKSFIALMEDHTYQKAERLIALNNLNPDEYDIVGEFAIKKFE